MQTIVVTGTSRGIGKAIAEYLCQEKNNAQVALSQRSRGYTHIHFWAVLEKQRLGHTPPSEIPCIQE